MTNRKPSLYSLKDIPKADNKTITQVCPSCKREFTRKAGRVFFCPWGCDVAGEKTDS